MVVVVHLEPLLVVLVVLVEEQDIRELLDLAILHQFLLLREIQVELQTAIHLMLALVGVVQEVLDLELHQGRKVVQEVLDLPMFMHMAQEIQ